jgi:hypothetical protein
MILRPENIGKAQGILEDGGFGSYPAFDGTGLVVVFPEGDTRLVQWGDYIGDGEGL